MNNRSERGALIVEATIVFPIMFTVVLLLFFLGNAFYQKARVERIVTDLAIEGASYCADPMLSSIEKGTIPGLNTKLTMPYRYFSGKMNSVESDVRKEAIARLDKLDSGLFSGMRPAGYKNSVNVHFKNHIIASSFYVSVTYKVVLPWRIIGASENFGLKFSAYCEIPVNDSPEFIRNVDMVEDYLERTPIGEKIKGMTEKIKGAFEKVNELFPIKN